MGPFENPTYNLIGIIAIFVALIIAIVWWWYNNKSTASLTMPASSGKQAARSHLESIGGTYHAAKDPTIAKIQKAEGTLWENGHDDPLLNYDTYMTDTVVKWVDGMKPFNGGHVAAKIDTLDVGDYVSFVGLRRPRPVAVNNPMQLQEVSPEDLSNNRPFTW